MNRACGHFRIRPSALPGFELLAPVAGLAEVAPGHGLQRQRHGLPGLEENRPRRRMGVFHDEPPRSEPLDGMAELPLAVVAVLERSRKATGAQL
jgi:hypothetical protein